MSGVEDHGKYGTYLVVGDGARREELPSFSVGAMVADHLAGGGVSKGGPMLQGSRKETVLRLIVRTFRELCCSHLRPRVGEDPRPCSRTLKPRLRNAMEQILKPNTRPNYRLYGKIG